MAEHTDLKGGIVTSTQKAEDEGLNSFTTATLSASDVENYMEYEGDSFGVSATASYNFADPKTQTGQTTTTDTPKAGQKDGQFGFNKSIGYGSEGESQTSVTKSGINTSAITITDEAAQVETGTSTEEIIAQVHTDTTTDTLEANSGALVNSFDAAEVQKELDVSTRVTQTFDTTRQEVKAYLNTQIDEANKIINDPKASDADKAKAEIERNQYQELGVLVDSISGALYTPSDSALGTVANALAPEISYQIGQYFKDEGEEGSAAHILAHTIVAGLVAEAAGNDALSAAISAGGSEALAPMLSELLYGTDDTNKLDADQKETVSAILSLGSSALTSATGGSNTDIVASGMASSMAVEDNRQLHKVEITWINDNAAAFAKELYGEDYTEEELDDAKARLAQQALRQIDKAWSYALGSETDEAAAAFLQTNLDGLFVVKDEYEYKDGSITRYGDTVTEISDLSPEEYAALKNFYRTNVYVPTSTNADGSIRPINEGFANEMGQNIDNLENIDGETINQAIRDFFPNLIESIFETGDVINSAGNYIDALAPTTNAERMDDLYYQGNAGSQVQANLATTDFISTVGMAVGTGAVVKSTVKSVDNALNNAVEDGLDIKMDSVDSINIDLGTGPNGGKGTLTGYNTVDGYPIIQRESGGYYYYNDDGIQVPINSPTEHGNTIGNQPADVYKRYDADGNYLKTGISQDASTRYSDIELNGGYVDSIITVPRTEAVKIERIEVETNPGPLNNEPWAGKKDPTHPNYDPNYVSPYDKP